MITGIIMASGYSRRMGENKLLLEIDGKKLIEYVIIEAKKSKLDNIFLIYKDEELKVIGDRYNIKSIYNEKALLGQSESMKLGIENSNIESHYMFLVGDQPFINSEIINSIIDTHYQNQDNIIVPLYGENRGMPTIFPNKYKYELLNTEGDIGGRDIIKENINSISYIGFNINYGLDIDTRENLEYIIKLKEKTWYMDLIDDLKASRDRRKSIDMENYMRNKFEFLGIQSIERRKISNPYFKEIKKSKTIDWDFIYKCWEDDYRELQYIALDYLKYMDKFLRNEDLYKLEKLIINKSWWDTIDSISSIVGTILLNNTELKSIILKWSLDDNFWKRRVAILHQLKYKDNMDIELLEKIIENNLGTDEFFINKAIGWILREYSKIDRIWVKNYIEKNIDKLDSLTIREGSKYI